MRTPHLPILALLIASTAMVVTRTSAGEYRVAKFWPTGIHEAMIPLDAENAPMCRALTEAANQSGAGKPLNDCPLPKLSGSSVDMPQWQPAKIKNPFDVAKRMLLADRWLWQNQSRHEAILSDLKVKLASGALFLEATTIRGFRKGETLTHLLRLSEKDCSGNPPFFYGQEIAISDSEKFERFDVLTNANAVFSYGGRSYGFATEDASVDGSSSRYKLFRNSHRAITAYELLNLSSETPGTMVGICHAIYWPEKTSRAY